MSFTFEFVLKGPPVSVNAKNKARYQAWVNEVRAAAKQKWPFLQKKAVTFSVMVQVTNYYRVLPERPRPAGVDIAIKPILAGMETVAYDSTGQVSQIICDRCDLVNPVDAPSPVLAEGLTQFSELIYVRASWDDKE